MTLRELSDAERAAMGAHMDDYFGPRPTDALAEGVYEAAWRDAASYFRAALAARDEALTHFEWPERGETLGTACGQSFGEPGSHTSYRKEVTCIACLQAMLAARGAGELPKGAQLRAAFEAGMQSEGTGDPLDFDDWVRDTEQEQPA